MTPNAKALCAAMILACWGFLAYQGLTPMEAFVAVLRDALVALGTFTATTFIPKQ